MNDGRPTAAVGARSSAPSPSSSPSPSPSPSISISPSISPPPSPSQLPATQPHHQTGALTPTEQNGPGHSLLGVPKHEDDTNAVPYKAKRTSLVSRIFTNGWGMEILAWFVSVLSVMSIFIVLAVYNHKALPDWPLGISINAGVAVLSQVGSTTLLVPVASCISQLKWVWFSRRSQPLSDFEIFDAGSRGGPFDNMALIWKTRASHWASLGALLTILTLGFQPFAQQAVNLPLRLVPQLSEGITNTAELQTIYNITNADLIDQTADTPSKINSIPLSLIASVFDGLNGGHTLSDVAPSCSTGNCTWNTYDTLAICAAPVANLTHLLKTNINDTYSGTELIDRVYNYSLPNGLGLIDDAGETEMNMTAVWSTTAGNFITDEYSGGVNVTSVAYPNQPLILDFFLIFQVGQAIEGALSFCGQTYNTSVENGTTTTALLSTWGQLNTTSVYDDNPLPIYAIKGPDTTLWLSNNWLISFKATLINLFTGTQNVSPDGNEGFGGTPHPAIQAFWDVLSNTTISPEDYLAHFNDIMESVAASMSNAIRTGPGSTTISGTVLTVETYVEPLWAWLAFPVALEILVLILLLITMWKSYLGQGPRKAGSRLGLRGANTVWKSSSLAVLTGLSAQTRGNMGGLRAMNAVEERVKMLRVRLMEDHEGAEWSLIEDESS